MVILKMEQINYQKLLEKLLINLKSTSKKPTLLLHCCCAPCSSYVFEYLIPFFNITALFYNPNIEPFEEYTFRLTELKRLINEMNLSEKINIIEESYEPDRFDDISYGLESCPEGSVRCFNCYYLRLLKTAEIAKKFNFDFFATTLTISPYKNSYKINEIGKALSLKFGLKYLFSDFKKNNGYKRSIELSKKYNLYRQNYCGCKFSKQQHKNKSI